MSDIEGLRRYGGWELTDDGPRQYSPTDAEIIKQRIRNHIDSVGALPNPDNGFSLLSFAYDGEIFVGFRDRSLRMHASYRKEAGGRITQALFGNASVAGAALEDSISLVSERDGDKEVEYRLRGKIVTDPQKIGAVREALGLIGTL